jgi:hypothetical protein
MKRDLLFCALLFVAAAPAAGVSAQETAPAVPPFGPSVPPAAGQKPVAAPAVKPNDPYEKPAAPGGAMDPYGKTPLGSEVKPSQAPVAPWQGVKTIDEQVTRQNRLSGSHLFPSPALFRSPLLTSRFGFSQGFAIISGRRVVETVDGTKPYALTAVGAHENLSAAARPWSWLGFDLDLAFDALAGVNVESALAMGGITNFDLSLGPVFALPTIKATNTAFTLGARLAVHLGLQVSPIGGLNAIIRKSGEMGKVSAEAAEVKGQLVSAVSYTGVRPSIGIVQPFFKWGGIQLEAGFARLSAKRSKADGSGDESQTVNSASVGAALSLDGRHIFNFPLVATLEYFGDSLNTEKKTTLGAGLYYQGTGEIQLGAFIADTIAKDPEIESYNGVVGQMTMIYYF